MCRTVLKGECAIIDCFSVHKTAVPISDSDDVDTINPMLVSKQTRLVIYQVWLLNDHINSDVQPKEDSSEFNNITNLASCNQFTLRIV